MEGCIFIKYSVHLLLFFHSIACIHFLCCVGIFSFGQISLIHLPVLVTFQKLMFVKECACSKSLKIPRKLKFYQIYWTVSGWLSG